MKTFLTQLLFLPRSPVFRAMLEAGMMEGLKGRVKVEDTEPAILRQQLRELYTSQLGPDGPDYQELLVLVSKYQLEDQNSHNKGRAGSMSKFNFNTKSSEILCKKVEKEVVEVILPQKNIFSLINCFLTGIQLAC